MNRIDATTPYTAEKAKIYGVIPSSFSGYMSKGEAFSQVVSDTNFLRFTPKTFPSPSAADTLARTKFYEKAAASFDAGTFAGELKSTLRMLRSPAVALRKATDVYLSKAHRLRSSVIAEARLEKQRLLRPGTSVLLGNRAARIREAERLALKSARKRYRTLLPELYLEAVFGWQPLINDIENLFDHLSDLLAKPGIEHFRVQVTEKSEVPKQLLDTTGNQYWRSEYYRTEHRTTQVQYKGAIYSEKHHDLDFNSRWNLRPGDLVVAGWNLLPHSFLVDYFVNIGDILQAMVLYQRIRYVYVSKTIRQSNRVYLESRNFGSNIDFRVTGNTPGVGSIEVRKTTRSKVSAVPIPALTLTVAQNTKRLLNIGALTHLSVEGSDFGRRVRL